jgi:hypothetical protein
VVPGSSGAALILQLQGAVGNRRVATLLAGAPRVDGGDAMQEGEVIQRLLDYESFRPKGTTSVENMTKIQDFAKTIGTIVDNTYAELMAGRVKGWTGAKLAVFIDLVNRGHPMAVTHAANVVEERVYAIMKKTPLPLKYKEQFSEKMGGASKPDIVIHVPDGKEALIDITSDRFHILRKAGAWESSDHYVYLAEAYFPPITSDDVAIIKEAMEKGGIDPRLALTLKMEADALRLAKMAGRQAAATDLRAEVWQAGSFAKWALASRLTKSQAAEKLREYGIEMKGMPRRRKGPKELSVEGKKKRQQNALKKRKELRAKKLAEARAKSTPRSESDEMVVEAEATPEVEGEATIEQDFGGDDDELMEDDEEAI